jgi:hypothetical protein
MEDCLKCNQTKENCECHIPDKEKHKGLFNLIKDIREKNTVREYYYEREVPRDPYNNPYTLRQVYARVCLLLLILAAMVGIIIWLSN